VQTVKRLEETNRLHVELKRVEQERDILKKSNHFCVTASIMSHYQFIEQEATIETV
jgi:hypothetical protein